MIMKKIVKVIALAFMMITLIVPATACSGDDVRTLRASLFRTITV